MLYAELIDYITGNTYTCTVLSHHR